MRDIGLLVVRVVLGGFLFGHGTQKGLGWFNGMGYKKTVGWLEGMGLKPGEPWAAAVTAGEMGGGLLTALGLFHPLGSVGVLASMLMATATAHWGNPIWVTEGGPELPVTNSAIALGLSFTGPGRFSLDRALGIRIPKSLLAAVMSAATVAVALGIVSHQDHVKVKDQEEI